MKNKERKKRERKKKRFILAFGILLFLLIGIFLIYNFFIKVDSSDFSGEGFFEKPEIVVESLEKIEFEAGIEDSLIKISNKDYLDLNLDLSEVFFPSELENLLKIQNSDFEIIEKDNKIKLKMDFSLLDDESKIPEGFGGKNIFDEFEIDLDEFSKEEKFSREIYNEEDYSLNFSLKIHNQYFVVSYSFIFEDEVLDYFEEVYSGRDPEILPIEFRINRYKRNEVYNDRASIVFDNLYGPKKDLIVVVAIPKDKEILEVDFPEEYFKLEGDYYQRVLDSAISLNKTQTLLDNPEDYKIIAYNTSASNNSLNPYQIFISSELGEENRIGMWLLGSFGGGSGSALNPFEVRTWAQLAEIKDYLSFSFILMNNLDNETEGYSSYAGSSANGGEGWIPIGNSTTRFTGTFDGNGYNISNLYISRSSSSYQGLFGYTGASGNNAEIMNLNLLDINISGDSNTGGLVGRMDYTSISNVHVSGEVFGTISLGGVIGYSGGFQNYASYSSSSVNVNSSSYNVGGFIGYAGGNMNISNSFSIGDVSGNYNVGGFVGRAYGFNEISNSYSAGDVYGIGSVSSSVYLGGFAGSIQNGLVKNSYSKGNVLVYLSGSTPYVYFGGFAGELRSTEINNCYSQGDVIDSSTGTWTSRTGGFSGYGYYSSVNNSYSTGNVIGDQPKGFLGFGQGGTISNSFWDTQTSGQTLGGGGTGKTTSEMKDIDTFTNTSTSGLDVEWDMITLLAHDGEEDAAIWFIEDGNDYPRLWVEYLVPVLDISDPTSSDPLLVVGGQNYSAYFDFFEGESEITSGVLMRELWIGNQKASLVGEVSPTIYSIFYEDFESGWVTTTSMYYNSAGSTTSIGDFTSADNRGGDYMWAATSSSTYVNNGTYALVVGDWDAGAITNTDGLRYNFNPSTSCGGSLCNSIELVVDVYNFGLDASEYCWITEQVGSGTPTELLTIDSNSPSSYENHVLTLSSPSSTNTTLRIMCKMNTYVDTVYFDDFRVRGLVYSNPSSFSYVLGEGWKVSFTAPSGFKGPQDLRINATYLGVTVGDLEKNSILYGGVVMDEVDILPLSLGVDDTLNGYCKGTDYGSSQDLNYYYIWYKNDTEYSSGYTSISTGSGVKVLVGTIPSSSTSFGDKWALSCRATTGTENSTWMNSSVSIIGGSGTLDDPFQIRTWHDLAEMNGNLSAHYILLNSLDESSTGYDSYASPLANGGSGWAPIGIDSSNRFSGTLNGNGNTISGIYVGSGTYKGLFGYLTTNSEVYNLGVLNVSIGTGSRSGGIAGAAYNSIIYNSFTGGVINSSTSSGGYIGGLVGYFTGTGSVVSNSYSNMTLNGLDRAGGLIGYFYQGEISNSYAYGSVSGGSSSGGLIGQFSSATSTGSFWDTQTSGQSSSSGSEIGKTTSEMKNMFTFSSVDWSILPTESYDGEEDTAIWFIDDGNDYPRLWFEFVVPCVSLTGKKFEIKNSTGGTCFEVNSSGMAVIYGNLDKSCSTSPTGKYFEIKTNSGSSVAWINESCDMCVSGNFLDEQTISYSSNADSFFIIDVEGDVLLKASFSAPTGNIQISGTGCYDYNSGSPKPV